MKNNRSEQAISLLASDYFGVALVFYIKEIFCQGTERHKNIDFTNCLTILRARKYGANTIEGTRRRERKSERGREDAKWPKMRLLRCCVDRNVVVMRESEREGKNVQSARGWKGERETEGYERRGTGMTAEGGRVEREKASGVGAVAMS